MIVEAISMMVTGWRCHGSEGLIDIGVPPTLRYNPHTALQFSTSEKDLVCPNM